MYIYKLICPALVNAEAFEIITNQSIQTSVCHISLWVTFEGGENSSQELFPPWIREMTPFTSDWNQLQSQWTDLHGSSSGVIILKVTGQTTSSTETTCEKRFCQMIDVHVDGNAVASQCIHDWQWIHSCWTLEWEHVILWHQGRNHTDLTDNFFLFLVCCWWNKRQFF